MERPRPRPLLCLPRGVLKSINQDVDHALRQTQRISVNDDGLRADLAEKRDTPGLKLWFRVTYNIGKKGVQLNLLPMEP